jgi:hypothetical protein
MKFPTHSKPYTPQFITLSIGAAASWFDMSDNEFARTFIRSGRLRLDSLHQLKVRDVFRVGREYGYIKRSMWDRT